MREYCTSCHYPTRVCLCAHIQAVHHEPHVVILQHPQESQHAKNTVRLLQLCLTKVSVVQGEKPDDFLQSPHLQNLSADTTKVIYPSETSALYDPDCELADYQASHTLLFIDASWRKAYKIWQQNPWLHAFPTFHLPDSLVGKYRIRSTRKDNALSTLEAVSYVLKTGYGADCSGLDRLFEQFQARWQSFAE